MNSLDHPLITGLYVPGDRPDRFDKAVASGAHLVILDLEDAVAADRKQAARDAVAGWLSARGSPSLSVARGPVIQVRVNADSDADLAALAGSDASFELRVPKVEAASDLDRIVRAAPGRALTPLLETARGVENAALIARHPAVTRLALGQSDLASDLGTPAAAVMDYARIRVLYAARAAGLPAPMLSAFTDIRNLDGLRADTERGRALGWVGRTAVHPSQLAVIIDVFRPTAAEEDWARQVLAALDQGGAALAGVATLESGEMVDAAMLGRARSTLALAEASGLPTRPPAESEAPER
ncbi:HpcH/HpaI aldolase/citrate lyase family protein [Glaciibacter sp. 2TAF33]|uniref:HpcH/HpaI aldolase/citrate lyase family protein n=1 Tax=Glaciibacter sp. 2TAF33 TaxID=3233015 RepID=UPI003F8DB888